MVSCTLLRGTVQQSIDHWTIKSMIEISFMRTAPAFTVIGKQPTLSVSIRSR